MRLKGQVDDMARQLNDLNALKAKLTQENFDLQHQVELSHYLRQLAHLDFMNTYNVCLERLVVLIFCLIFVVVYVA